jgi:hypothetical protein
MDTQTYQSYKGLPSLAGICTMKEAAKPGLSVEECVRRLKRYHYAYKRLHQIFMAHIASEPIYELKMGYSLHSYLCAEQVSALAKRVGEMREPPLGLEAVPDANLEIFFDEILAAPSTEERLVGIYEKAFPALQAALEQHMKDTNPLADHPSVRLCRLALIELADMIAFGRQSQGALINSALREGMSTWIILVDGCLAAAGGLDGTSTPSSKPITRQYSAQPFVYDPVPHRDERFPDPYNMGVNAEVFLYDPQFPPAPKTLMMAYKRIREIDVPEMMSSIILETKGKSWDYTLDMTRQLWDEARHAMMGEVGFVAMGIDWHKVMVNFTWSLGLNTQLTPIERHAVLYFIEQGLMPRTGKRFEWEVAVASHNPLSATFQDYDWADEVLHAHIGRDWYVTDFSSPKQAVEYGDKCWSKVLMNWSEWRDQGLTEHRNWWPDVYRAACEVWGIEPDADVLAFSESYAAKRADLKDISASG